MIFNFLQIFHDFPENFVFPRFPKTVETLPMRDMRQRDKNYNIYKWMYISRIFRNRYAAK